MSESTATLDREEVKDVATAQKYFGEGKKAEDAGDRVGAVESYEAAYTADPDDLSVCFRLAYNLDLMGEEDEALHLYEECVRQEQPSLNALINLGVMYEDRGKYAQAERCIRQVLATDSNHLRAQLYLKDILASKAMVIDDEQDKRVDKHNAMLDTPVTDFSLTVRTRNALRKMNIRTLGDLLRVSESDLRSFRNFGDASIEEIKAMLAQRGLRLGQALEAGRQEGIKQRVVEQLGDSQEAELMTRSVNDLGLSVRARKALALLNIQSVGDLVAKTEAELMGVKNFGMTSLFEIKEKLAERGLSLRILDDGEEEGE